MKSERVAFGNGPKQHGERRPPPRHVTLLATPCSHAGRQAMATAGDLVEEDLGRMNRPPGSHRRIPRPWLVARTMSELSSLESHYGRGFYRHPDRIRNLETSQSVPEKTRQSNAWPLSFDIRSTWLEREPLWVVFDQRLVIPLRRPRHTNSPQAAAGDGRDGREAAVRPRLESGCRD